MSVHEHIEPGDPRYDGFRIRELWLLCRVDPGDDQEGVVTVTHVQGVRHRVAMGMAIASDARRAHHLRELGQGLARRGEQVTLKRFVLREEEVL